MTNLTLCALSPCSTCAISLIRLAYLKQGPDFTFDNVPTSCWSAGEISCGIICACLPTLRPLVAKVKPAWITSTRRTRQKYAYGGSHSKGAHHYGEGAFGNAVDIKGAATPTNVTVTTATNRSRSTRDSILASSTLNGSTKNYSRIRDTDGASVLNLGVGAGVEQQQPPMPPSPAYRMPLSHRRSDNNIMMESDEMHMIGGEWDGSGRDVESGYGEDREGVYQMRSLQPRAKQQQGNSSLNVHDKAMEVLGMGKAGTGVSTEVTGGRLSMSSSHQGGAARSKQGGSMAGIEVKRVVVVTTSDAEDERSHGR